MPGLEDLQKIKQELQAQAAREKAEQAARLLAAKRAEKERNLFESAVGKVQRLPTVARADLKRPAPPANVLQHELDAQAALQESLSDEFDVSSLLDTDQDLSFRRPGVGADVDAGVGVGADVGVGVGADSGFAASTEADAGAAAGAASGVGVGVGSTVALASADGAPVFSATTCVGD